MNVPAAGICAITSCDDTGIPRGSFTEADVPPFYPGNDYFAFFTPLFVIVTLRERLLLAQHVCASVGVRHQRIRKS